MNVAARKNEREKKMGEIRIVKEKQKTSDYTFQDDGLNIGNSESSSEKKELDTKKKAAQDFRLREGSNINKLRKSKIIGGHSMQGHSPVYE